jgi:pimeloyl-ACP methyl ester carboxylesterase
MGWSHSSLNINVINDLKNIDHMKLNFYIAAIGTVFLLTVLSDKSLVAQQISPEHTPEVWYMGMNDSEKPRLFMKSVGVGDTVLVLHGGFGAEHSYLLDLVKPLTGEFHFVLFDQRGSLRSPAPDSLLSFQYLIEDIEWIREELEVDKLTLLGHSMGTRLAMAYTDAYPNHVKNLVLVSAVDPALRIPEGITDVSQLPPLRSRLAEKYLKARPEVKKALQEMGLSLDSDLANLSYKQRSDLWRIKFASANIYNLSKWREITGGMALFNSRSMRLIGGSAPEPFDYTNSLRKAEIPITVIAGDHDFGNFEALSYEELYRDVIDSTAAEIPENIFPAWSDYKSELPRLEVYSIEKAGHNPWVDRPDEVKRALRKALSRQ